MSQFDYKAKLDVYAPSVIYYLENDNDKNKISINSKGLGFIEAIDGNDYKVDIKSTNFKKLIIWNEFIFSRSKFIINLLYDGV